MKLLQINSVANSGSTGHITEYIGSIAISKGWESYIAYGRCAQPSRSYLIKIGSKLSVLYHVFLTRFFDKHGLGSKLATQKLIAQIKEVKPDIIHLHNIHGYYINYPILFDYLLKSNIPVVWTLHDCWSFTGHCSYFDYIKCEKWKSICFNCPQKKSYPQSWFFDNSKSNYLNKKESFSRVNNLILVPVSNWLSNLIDYSFLSTLKKELIYNGVDLNVFNFTECKSEIYSKYKINAKYLVLGVANNWGQRKGLNDFYSLRKKLSKNFIIVLVGLTKKQLSKLPEGIIGIQRTENVHQLSQLYSASDVFVNPTWEDNFPTTNIESLACGTPIISYNTGGSVEAVTPDTGVVVHKGDIDGLSKAIQLICSKGKAFYQSACLQRAVDFFDKNKNFEKYFELYESLLKDKEID